MEARLIRAATLAAIVIVSMGAGYRTPNFVVETQSAQLAEEFGKTAEKLRHDLAIAWLGEAMPQWNEPCPITVRVGPGLGAGGMTNFVFNDDEVYDGEVYDWRMSIQGSRERVLDSVLPHEITHMIFASYFRCPLPRWADEGGATSVEHQSELEKHRKMLLRFLRNRRGIAFNKMFAMFDYPPDIMPLYAQGVALSEFLIQQGGRRKFVEYLGDALENDNWATATKEHYGYASLGELQQSWQAWVGRGFPAIERPIDPPVGNSQPEVLLAGAKPPRPKPNLIWRIGRKEDPAPPRMKVAATKGGPNEAGGEQNSATSQAMPVRQLTAAGERPSMPSKGLSTSGWRAVGDGSDIGQQLARETPMPNSQPIRTEVTHPQPVEKSRQIILEWHQ